MHRYMSLNDKVGGEEVADVPRVKRTPVKKVVSKKRPAVATAAEPVGKKKRTSKSKSVSAQDNLEILPVAQEAVPIQIIEPTPAAPAEQPPVPKRKIQKRKRRLVLGSDDDIVEQPAAEVSSKNTVGEPAVEVAGETVVEESTLANVLEEQQKETVVENIAEPVSEPAVEDVANTDVAETAVIESGVGEQAALRVDELEQWFNLSYEEFHAHDAGQPVVTASYTDEDMETVEEMETEVVEQSADEAMSLEDILMTIPVECPLPSANVEITPITLGESIFLGSMKETVTRPVYPRFQRLIRGRLPFRKDTQLRYQEVSESIDESYFDKEALILSWAETDSTRAALNRRMYILTKYRELLIRKFLVARKINFFLGEGSSATDLKVLEMLSDLHMFVVEYLKVQTMAHGIRWEKTKVLCKIDHVERVFLDSLPEQNETFRGLFKHSRQEAQNDNNALSLALKDVQTQNVILSTDLEATRKEVKDLKAALSKDFDDKLADIRNEHLEFRIETHGQLASLGIHLAELIAFLTKGIDDKKGEDSSSRRPQPPPDDQSRPSGGSGGSGNRADEQSRPFGSGTRESGSQGESQRKETVVDPQKEGDQVSTRSVLGKWVYLITLAMSLFDLQDVCIAIGSLAILDLPMVVDLIGIYGLKGPYCTLTTTNWFLQELSVIPRGSWRDVSRRFTIIRWASPKL
ncbi:hypothetical protein F511_27289 [Dorcoceras hygrometricum]|uniref:Uncharacterized protein n=1 Tax=Dorcoceras hygrometricum TaxID=472368 RepID=A0A2Z7CSJ7_9LAMI|nr:hypothetical protein F511_27289 [Dorcoceras hygrometricum]